MLSTSYIEKGSWTSGAQLIGAPFLHHLCLLLLLFLAVTLITIRKVPGVAPGPLVNYPLSGLRMSAWNSSLSMPENVPLMGSSRLGWNSRPCVHLLVHLRRPDLVKQVKAYSTLQLALVSIDTRVEDGRQGVDDDIGKTG